MHSLLVCNVIAQNTLNLRTTYCNNAKNERLITQFKTASCRLQFSIFHVKLKEVKSTLTVLDKGALGVLQLCCLSNTSHNDKTSSKFT